MELLDHLGKPIQQPSDTRNLAFSSMLQTGMPAASFSSWTVRKAVKDGMKSSVWVYRSNDIVSFQAAGVPLIITDNDNSPIEAHRLNAVLKKPNPQIPPREMYQLIYLWLLLAGKAYLSKIQSSKQTEGFWPVSPDRLTPIRSRDVEFMIEGYGSRKHTGAQITKEFEVDEIIAFKLIDPSNPIEGISPLQAASRIVDIDNDQQNFNKSAMQNRGVLDGIVSFKTPMNRDQLTAQRDSWNERNGGGSSARGTAFIGGDASYTRFSLTPTEMDFRGSRKDNRDEILSAHGVPGQLVGAQESSTYNNFAVSESILWKNRIIPLVEQVAENMTFAFRNSGELTDIQKVTADFSSVKALQQIVTEKADAGNKLYDMGIPVQQISKMLSLGVQEYKDWDKSFNGKEPKAVSVSTSTRSRKIKTVDDGWKPQLRSVSEIRAIDIEDENDQEDELATSFIVDIMDVFNATALSVESQIDTIRQNPEAVADFIVQGQSEDFSNVIHEIYIASAVQFGRQVVIETRDAFDDALTDSVNDALAVEGTILNEVSLINATTSAAIVDQVQDGLLNGLTNQEIAEAISDTGIFSAERALGISRTVTGTGASIGQLTAATISGAAKKTWRDSIIGVRDLHKKRRGETVGINERFKRVSDKRGVFPRFPLDPELSGEDRIN